MKLAHMCCYKFLSRWKPSLLPVEILCKRHPHTVFSMESKLTVIRDGSTLQMLTCSRVLGTRFLLKVETARSSAKSSQMATKLERFCASDKRNGRRRSLAVIVGGSISLSPSQSHSKDRSGPRPPSGWNWILCTPLSSLCAASDSFPFLGFNRPPEGHAAGAFPARRQRPRDRPMDGRLTTAEERAGSASPAIRLEGRGGGNGGHGVTHVR